MKSPTIARPERAGFSPRIMGAAASVTVLSLLGIGAVTGLPPELLARQDSGEVREVVPAYRPLQGNCAICGTVASIRALELTEATVADDASGPGGTLVGHPLGGSEGNVVMAIPGAAGRAFSRGGVAAGGGKRYVYRVTVRMDDGSYRAVSLPEPPSFAVGDKVRVVESRLVRA